MYKTQDVITFNLGTILSGHPTFMEDEETHHVRGTEFFIVVVSKGLKIPKG
jgi:hypothetical protein